MSASPRGSFFANDSSVTGTFDVPWQGQGTSGFLFTMRRILGSPSVGKVGDLPSGYYISRQVPVHHPDYMRSDGKPFLFATRVNLEGGFGMPPNRKTITANGTATFKRARLGVTFSTLPYEVLTDAEMIAGGFIDSKGNPDEGSLKRYVEIIPKTKGDMANVSAGNLWFCPPSTRAGTKFLGNVGLGVPRGDIRIVWHQVPRDAIGSRTVNPNLGPTHSAPLDDYVNTINTTVFMNQRAGTLLFLGADIRPGRSPFGDRVYTVELVFDFYPPGQYKVVAVSALPPTDPGEQYKFEHATIATAVGNYDPPNAAAPLTVGPGVLIFNHAEHRDPFRVPAY